MSPIPQLCQDTTTLYVISLVTMAWHLNIRLGPSRLASCPDMVQFSPTLSLLRIQWFHPVEYLLAHYCCMSSVMHSSMSFSTQRILAVTLNCASQGLCNQLPDLAIPLALLFESRSCCGLRSDPVRKSCAHSLCCSLC